MTTSVNSINVQKTDDTKLKPILKTIVLSDISPNTEDDEYWPVLTTITFEPPKQVTFCTTVKPHDNPGKYTFKRNYRKYVEEFDYDKNYNKLSNDTSLTKILISSAIVTAILFKLLSV